MKLRSHPVSHDAELRVFSPGTYTSLSFDVCSFVEEHFRHHNNISKQQQYQPNSSVVAVVVVALGRSLYFLSQSPPNLLAQLLL